ncbi:MAG: hypothetical protein AB7S92_04575 [Parvibaculaceae bacterium]
MGDHFIAVRGRPAPTEVSSVDETAPAGSFFAGEANWSGLYAGLKGGAGALLSDAPEADARFAGDGVLGSLMAGFGWQAGES